MFTVAPIGIMKLLMEPFTLSSSSAVFKERGITAAELVVENANS